MDIEQGYIFKMDKAFTSKPNKNIFPEDERIIVEVFSLDGQSVYRFEKVDRLK